MREGNVFTGVCDSVHGGVPAPGGVRSSGVAWSRGKGGASAPGGLVETPRTATAAGGTHPTGMHSCLLCVLYFREDFDRYLQQAADDRRRTEEDRMYLQKLLEEVKN